MVMMDKEDYTNKAQELLSKPAYKEIPRDPTNKIKAELITKLRKIKNDTNLDEVCIRLHILLVVSCPSFMGYQKSIKQAILSGPLSLAGVSYLWDGQSP